jgi:hypothetical protein
MSYILYECPSCAYLDSDKEMAESHCLDNHSGLWS